MWNFHSGVIGASCGSFYHVSAELLLPSCPSAMPEPVDSEKLGLVLKRLHLLGAPKVGVKDRSRHTRVSCDAANVSCS